MGLQNITLTQAESREIYIPTVWWIQSPQTVPLPFLLGFLHFPKHNKQLNRIWHKRFLLHPFPPINRTWQRKSPANVKSTANSIKDGPFGIKINQDYLPSEGGTEAGKGFHQLLVLELENTMQQESASTAGTEKTEYILS